MPNPKHPWNDRSHDKRFENFIKTGNPWARDIMKILCEELQRFIKRKSIKTPDSLELYSKEALKALAPVAAAANNPNERAKTCVKQYIMFWKEKIRLYGNKTGIATKLIKIKAENQEKLYLPTRKDCEEVIEELKKRKLTSEISQDEVLNFLETNLSEKGIFLQDNWRMVTTKNFKNWFL